MSQKPTTYLILTAGTVVCQGSYDEAPRFVLENPTLALIREFWDESFMIGGLFERNGKPVTTGLLADYVLKPIGEFDGGQTKEEAWQKFDQK